MTAIFLALASSGCQFRKELKKPQEPLLRQAEPAFPSFYDYLNEENDDGETEAQEEKKITLSASGMKLIEFLRYVSDKANVSIVCEERLDNLIVNVNVVDTDVMDVLSSIARRYSVDITEQGRVIYLGTLSSLDRAILVRKVKRLTAKEVVEMVQTLNSEVGKVAATNDGLTVVGDRVRILQKVNSMIDQVEQARTNTWVLQMYLISGNNAFSRELGVDTSLAFDVAATLANSHSKLASLGTFNAVLKSARSDSRNEVIAEPMMLITDGGQGSIQDGERIPIPRRTVSDAGTVNTTGYDYVNTGVVIKTSLREMSSSAATCDIEVEMTKVASYVDSAPVTAGQTFKTTAVLESGGTYLIGSLSRQTRGNERGGAFVNTFKGVKDNDSNVEIWLRCYRIRGGFSSSRSAPPTQQPGILDPVPEPIESLPVLPEDEPTYTGDFLDPVEITPENLSEPATFTLSYIRPGGELGAIPSGEPEPFK